MFFALLRADRYTGSLEADGGFELFPINGSPPRARANSNKPAMIAAAPTMTTAVVFCGIKPRISVNRPRASRNTP